MMRKMFLIPAVICMAAVLTAPGAAHAQKGGRGGGHAPAHGGAYHGGAYHGGYYRPAIGIGIGIGGPFYGYGYPYPYAYDPYYVVPRVAYYPPLVAGVEAPAQPDFQAPQPASTTAQIRVLVPNESAKVWFDGALTKQGGTDRLYHTPSLSGDASYRVRASWVRSGKEEIQEVVVPVTPGKMSVADFTKTSSEPVPAPGGK